MNNNGPDSQALIENTTTTTVVDDYPPSPQLNLRDIKLCELLAKGLFLLLIFTSCYSFHF